MSTPEYLQALRTTNYLFFLDWPEYIAQKYLGKNATQDADTTISLIVFEWMQYDLSKEDIASIANLYFLANENSGLLESTLGYAAIALSAAAMQCMVYKNQGISYPKATDMSTLEALTFIQKMEKLHDPQINNAQLKEAELQLQSLIKIQQHQIHALKCKLGYLLNLQDYIRRLQNDLIKDSDHPVRLGLLQALYAYVSTENGILTAAVQHKIQGYIVKIRNLTPDKNEQLFLTSLAPFPEESNLFWTALSWGVKLLLSNPLANNIEENQENERPSQNC